MKKIFDWIKTNLLGLETPRKRRSKKTRYSAKKVLPVRRRPLAAKKRPAKKILRPKFSRKTKANARQTQPAAKSVKVKPVKIPPSPKFQEKKVGVITHFFTNVSAAIVKVSAGIEIGDELHFKGSTTDFKIQVKSMQMNRLPILVAEKGQEIGIQVPDKVRQDDEVFKVIRNKS